MRIFNIDKTQELVDVDKELGYLQDDTLYIAYHDTQMEMEEQSHYEVIAEYDNGGKDVRKVVDIPYQEYRDAYDEYENIQVFVPYNDDELARQRQEKYEQTIVAKIRHRYSMSAEMAIHRQRDIKQQEWLEYDEYCELCKAEVKSEINN